MRREKGDVGMQGDREMGFEWFFLLHERFRWPVFVLPFSERTARLSQRNNCSMFVGVLQGPPVGSFDGDFRLQPFVVALCYAGATERKRLSEDNE